MTILNYTHGFLYIHVPKTAGTTVKTALAGLEQPGDIHVVTRSISGVGRHGEPIPIRKHSTAAQLRTGLGPKQFAKLFKFSVVRNPFSRTSSLFRFLKHNHRNWQNSEIMDRFDTLEEFVASEFFMSRGPGHIFLPQSHWLKLPKGALCVDTLARTESLDTDLGSVGRKLGLPLETLLQARRNVSKEPEGLCDMHSGYVVDIIRTKYASDFEAFGYSRDPAVPELGDA